MSVPEESEWATIIHGTCAFNTCCSPCTNPKTLWQISVEAKGIQHFFLLTVPLKRVELYSVCTIAVAWRMWLCWNTVKQGGKKKAYQYCQNSEVFCSSWMSVKLVHWLWAKALAGFSADRVRRADWKYGAFPPHASLEETMMILYETIMETIWFQIILIPTFCLCEVYSLLFLLSITLYRSSKAILAPILWKYRQVCSGQFLFHPPTAFSFHASGALPLQFSFITLPSFPMSTYSHHNILPNPFSSWYAVQCWVTLLHLSYSVSYHTSWRDGGLVSKGMVSCYYLCRGLQQMLIYTGPKNIFQCAVTSLRLQYKNSGVVKIPWMGHKDTTVKGISLPKAGK